MDEAARCLLLDRLRQIEAEKQSILAQIKNDPDVKAAPLPPIVGKVVQIAPPTDSASKISLFLELFRCRPDLYARRWENASADPKAASSGYVPALTRE
jgi:hypothetical protein